MADMLKLAHNVPVAGEDARKKVVEFLRHHADAIERGDEDASKALLVTYRDVAQMFAVRSHACNFASLVERVGVLHMALHDTAEVAD